MKVSYPTSEEAVVKATGKSWKEWVRILNKLGAKNMDHSQIAKMLWDKKLVKSGWWCQSVTVGYEYATGKRVVGQTLSTGYEIGAQKVIHLPQQKLWDFLNSTKGKKLWHTDKIEIRTIYPPDKIRLTWQPKKWSKPSVLQIYLECHRNTPHRTTLSFHQEKLTSSKQRETMRRHWQKVLERIDNLYKIT